MRKNLGTKPFFYPLPVLIIGSYDEKGKPDLMNAAWGGLYEADKVILSLSQSHQTTENIKVKKAFTISFAERHILFPLITWALCQQKMNQRKWKNRASTL